MIAKFEGSYLKQGKVFYKHRNVIICFIVYWLDTRSRDLNHDLTRGDFLFGTVKWTKNAGKYKYEHSSYSIGFDTRLD